jgi:hypothetical protein
MADEQDLSAVESIEVPSPESPVVLPIPQAIKELAPNTRWSMTGYDVSGIAWEDDPSLRPTNDAILEKAREILAEAPMRMLRRQRDARMREVDWVTLRAARTGEPVPQDWQDYMQALADITKNSTPRLVDGVLIGVEWPARPDGEPAGPYRG